MKKKTGIRLISAGLTMAMTALLFTGCAVQDKSEKEDSISVYLWSAGLYDTYARYIQSQLPDMDIEFVVGNNDLDFYTFMKENGALPDIITCRRFSLHDAADLQDQLMDLSTTEEAGAIYESYLKNFTNSDDTVNWLPLCGEVDGIVANREVFEKYDIPLPTDYESFVSACQAFEAEGIRGFVADFEYDYTCMEVLQGLSIPEINSLEGQEWRHRYEDPLDSLTGLDGVIWPGAFERMEQFIKDTHLEEEDLNLSYDPVIDMFMEGKAAMIRSGGSNVVAFQETLETDAVFLPYFGQNGEECLLTYPAFQVALNKDLEKDKTRRDEALKVLSVMLSDEGQNTLAKGEDVITYSQNVDLKLSPHLENLETYIKQNHLYIRVASNDFFSTSKDVVSKMIRGEYDAQQAYEAFDAQLQQSNDDSAETVLTVEEGYSNEFHKKGGNASASAMANSLRSYYGSDVLVAPAYSFTGSTFKGEYSETMAGYMVMPNSLEAWQSEMTGKELIDYLKASVEGMEGGFSPFNRGSLPAVSGISMEVQEEDGKYVLVRVLKDGKEIGDEDTFQVTCLNTGGYMGPFLNDESRTFEKMEDRVRIAWTEYVKNGGSLAEPENYITLK